MRLGFGDPEHVLEASERYPLLVPMLKTRCWFISRVSPRPLVRLPPNDG